MLTLITSLQMLTISDHFFILWNGGPRVPPLIQAFHGGEGGTSKRLDLVWLYLIYLIDNLTRQKRTLLIQAFSYICFQAQFVSVTIPVVERPPGKFENPTPYNSHNQRTQPPPILPEYCLLLGRLFNEQIKQILGLPKDVNRVVQQRSICRFVSSSYKQVLERDFTH